VERLKSPQQAAGLAIAQRTEDVERDHAAGDGPTVGGERLDAERGLVEHQRPVWPQRGTVGLEDDRGEDLDEVGYELAVAAVARAVFAERVPHGARANAR
jgi:hypothetical protein